MASCKSVDSSHRVSSIWEVFQELELAGEGTYGITYKAAPKDKLGQVVALKCISKKSPPGINLPRFKIAQNFDTEVELLRECDHPYIVKLLDTFEDDQFFVLVMEWLAGGQLFQRIVALDHFSELAASLVVSRMVSAVRYLHYKDIAHLDLKPENFVLKHESEDHSLKLIDFGLARRLDFSIENYPASGTGAYKSPEMIDVHGFVRTADILPKCDVFALGVIVFVLLTGEYPEFQFKQVVLPEDKKLSSSVKQLIQGMLEWDCEKRISIDEAFDHPWVKGHASDAPLAKSSLVALRTFLLSTRFQRTFVNIIAEDIWDKKKDDPKRKLSHLFNSLDLDHNGKLNVQELTHVLFSHKKLLSIEDEFEAKEKAGQFFELTGKSLSGDLSKDDIIGLEAMQDIMDGEIDIALESRNLFHVLDIDGNGNLTMSEMSAFLGPMSPREIEDLFKDVDEDGDGTISETEFCRAISTQLASTTSSPVMRKQSARELIRSISLPRKLSAAST